jgi:hypothetical protein
MVMFRASPNETVSVRTPSQQKSAERKQEAPAQPVENKIINIVDPSMLEEAMASEAGQKVILNTIGRNAGPVRALLNRRRS